MQLSALLIDLSAEEVAFEGEMVVEGSVDRGEFLQRFHLSKPQHDAFPSSERQMAVLRPVVGVTASLLLLPAAQFLGRCLV